MNPRIGASAFGPYSRYSLMMFVLSGTFWFTTWPTFGVPEDFPNCLYARYDKFPIGFRFLSHHRSSLLFITTEELKPGEGYWAERSDGHFCGFPTWPLDSSGYPTGFAISVDSKLAGWKCPYWLMGGVWLCTFLKTRSGFRFKVSDLLLTTTFLAVLIVLVQWRIVLPLAVLLNLSTVLLVCLFGVHLLRTLWRADNIWWPLVIEESIELGNIHGRHGDFGPSVRQ